MNSPEEIYTTPEHLTESQLLRYQADAMDDAEMHRVERHLLACELCSDALEGISMLEPRQAASAMTEVRSRLADRLEEQKTTPTAAYWRWAAAACILLLALTAVYLIFSNAESINQQPLVQQEIREEAEPVTPAETTMEAEPAVTAKTQPSTENNTPANQNKIADRAVHIREKPAAPVIAQQESIAPEPLSEAESPSPSSVSESLSGRVAGVSVAEESSFADAKPADNSLTPVKARRSAVNRPAPVQVPTESFSSSIRSKTDDLAKAGSRQITGKVIDSDSGDPIPGVSIRIRGTEQGTVTNMDGEYTLILPAKEMALALNFIGYQEKIVKVAPTDNKVEAVLEPDVEALSEVVVTGYSTRNGQDAATAPDRTTSPRPAAGMRDFKKWVQDNLRYPAAAAEAGIEGVVVVSFFVEANGTLSQFQVIKSPGYGLDDEAIRLLKEGPEWQPATFNDQPVRQQERVRIPFKLPKR